MPHLASYIRIETKHGDRAQMSRFEAEASVRCIRRREGFKEGGGGGNKARRPEGLICELQAKTDGGIPEEECFMDSKPLVGRGEQGGAVCTG